MHYFVSASIIILSASIPFINIFDPCTGDNIIRYIIAAIGSILTIASSVSLLGKYQERWVNYRKLAEEIDKERYLFKLSAYPYNLQNAHQLFVSNIETIIDKEVKEWYTNNKRKGVDI